MRRSTKGLGMWKDRRVSIDTKPASWFEANEKNFRMHPRSQAQAFVSVANSVGLIDAIKVNLRSQEEWGSLQNQPVVLDGHMRVMEALKQGDDTPLPVDFYDLNRKEEELVLLTLDYIAKLAGVDSLACSNLLKSVMENLDELEKDENLEGLLEMMARENNIFLDNFEEEEEDFEDVEDIPETGSGKVKLIVTCEKDVVEEIEEFLNSIDGVSWTRKKG